MNATHCCTPIWPAAYQLPQPFLAQVAVRYGDNAHEADHAGLAYGYAEDVLDLMTLTSVPGCPVRMEAFHVLEYALLDLREVPAATRGAMVAILGQLTEFALLHCPATSDWQELESAVQGAIDEVLVEPSHIPAIRHWFAETMWKAANCPRDEVAMRPHRDAGLEEVRVAFATAWIAAMNLKEPDKTVRNYRTFEATAWEETRAAERSEM